MPSCQNVNYFWHVISSKGINVDLSKGNVVLQWECPKTISMTKTFVGVIRYYRRFMIMTPLTQFTYNRQPFI